MAENRVYLPKELQKIKARCEGMVPKPKMECEKDLKSALKISLEPHKVLKKKEDSLISAMESYLSKWGAYTDSVDMFKVSLKAIQSAKNEKSFYSTRTNLLSGVDGLHKTASNLESPWQDCVKAAHAGRDEYKKIDEMFEKTSKKIKAELKRKKEKSDKLGSDYGVLLPVLLLRDLAEGDLMKKLGVEPNTKLDDAPFLLIDMKLKLALYDHFFKGVIDMAPKVKADIKAEKDWLKKMKKYLLGLDWPEKT